MNQVQRENWNLSIGKTTVLDFAKVWIIGAGGLALGEKPGALLG